MKYLRGSFILIIMVIIGCTFFKGEVKAGSVDFFEEYSGSLDYENGGYDEYSFRLAYECDLTVYFEYDEEESDMPMAMTVTISEEDGYTEFDEFLNFSGEYQKTITLDPGKYTLEVECVGLYYISLSGEYYPELSSEYVTLQEGKSKTLKVIGTNNKVKWSSSKKSVATVSNKGVIKAKKAGKAVIKAKCGKFTLKCNVKVKKKPVPYKVIAKKLKTFAKKNKNFKFKNIDVGKKCRLYGHEAISLTSESLMYKEGYILRTVYHPYIELVKKGNGNSEIRFRIYGEMYQLSIYGFTSLYDGSMQALTSNRRMKFSFKNIYNGNTYNSSENYYEGKIKGYTQISSSLKPEKSNLNKFNTMLGQNSLSMKLKSENSIALNGRALKSGIPAVNRKNWKKLVKEYNLLLKNYL